MIWLQEVTLARWTKPSGPLCLWQCFWVQFEPKCHLIGFNWSFCLFVTSVDSINLFLLQLMAPQEVRACCDLVSQTDQGSESWISRPGNLGFLEARDLFQGPVWFGGRKKVTQISKTGDVATSLAVSVYLEFKKRILPHHHNLTLPWNVWHCLFCLLYSR